MWVYMAILILMAYIFGFIVGLCLGLDHLKGGRRRK